MCINIYDKKKMLSNRIKYKDKTLEFYPGTKNKKYTVIIYNRNGKKEKTVNFGDKRYEQYEDITPLRLYTKLDHLDKKRRKLYRERHSKIKNNKGELVYQKEFTPSWFSWLFLW